MTTDTTRRYAEKVRDTMKAIAEADERNLDLLTAKEFDTAEHKVAAREARGLRATLLLYAANLAEAVLAGDQTESHFSLEEVRTAIAPWTELGLRADDVLGRLSTLHTTPAPIVPVFMRCPAELAGHRCDREVGHSTSHHDTRTELRW